MRQAYPVEVSVKFRPQCHLNYVPAPSLSLLKGGTLLVIIADNWLNRQGHFSKKGLTGDRVMYIIIVTLMARLKSPPPVDAKAAALRERGALHPHPEAIQDEAFRQGDFFDGRDQVQVRYEMLRRHRVEGRPVTEVAASFGVSRQAFYVTEALFEGQGLPGLLPRRRGPKRAHKCTEEILDFVEQWRGTAPARAEETIVQAIERRFGVSVNPRSIDRALARRKKKPRTKTEEKG